jgi:hypothetical protein
MSVTIGWWAAPLAIMIALFVWALIPRPSEARSGDYDFAFMLPAVFRSAGAIIGSLVVWLIWSLAR